MAEGRKSLEANFKRSFAQEQQELLATLFTAFIGDGFPKIVANKEDPRKLKTEWFYRIIGSDPVRHRHPTWNILMQLLPHFRSCLVFSEKNEPFEFNVIQHPKIPQVKTLLPGLESREPGICEITFTDLTSALKIFEDLVNDKIQYKRTYVEDKEKPKEILSLKRVLWQTRNSFKRAGDDVLGIIAGYLSDKGSAFFANGLSTLATLRRQSQNSNLDTQTKAALATFFASEDEGQSVDISVAKALAENPNEEVTSLLAKMITY
ncbi:MAG: hypothetical protein ACYCQI_08490 [Gammaproteobacteria bacterium]